MKKFARTTTPVSLPQIAGVQASKAAGLLVPPDFSIRMIPGSSVRPSENQEDLYANLAWLSQRQGRIERRLFEALPPGAKPALFLYDVTSSYLEGSQNELGAFGYNRDGKRGKKQIVLGLLCDPSGTPSRSKSLPATLPIPKRWLPRLKKW